VYTVTLILGSRTYEYFIAKGRFWMKNLFVALICAVCATRVAHGQETQPIVAIHDSELTRALETMPASGATPTGAGTTGFQWWPTSWHYFVMPDSVKEALRSDGTAFTVIGDSNIVAGVLTNVDGSPKYPIVISLASEAVGDNEISQLTNYVAAGGFLFVGSSSFTRNTNGTTRGDFAIANAMGIHMVNPNLTNWYADETFASVSANRLVSDIPSGQLAWQMPSSADEISWPTAIHLAGETPNAAAPGLPHMIWQVVSSNATVVAQGDGNLPYLLVKQYGKGYFIYDAAMQPLIGHGGWAPGMYAYSIFRNAIEWAFQSAKLPIPKNSPWPYPYDAAVIFRHDMEAIPSDIISIEGSAQFEHANGASGDYFFCTGTLREDMPNPTMTNTIASLKRAVSLYGATIGPHNGGLTNINPIYSPPLVEIEPNLTQLISEGWFTAFEPYTSPSLSPLVPFDYDYWHWGTDEMLDVTNLPSGYTNGAQYAYTSLSNSFSDIAGWGLTNGEPRMWVAPYFNATREGSYQIEQQLGIKVTGDDKLSPFPSWTLSTQTPDKRYSILQLPVSDWFIGTQVAQSLENGHTDASIQALVDFYYNMGALINLYCHCTSDGSGMDGPLPGYYCTYSLSKPRVWSANSASIYSWWLQRSNAQVAVTYTNVGNQSVTTFSISGESNTNAAVEMMTPSAAFTGLQVSTNGVLAGGNAYRTNGQAIKVLVGTSVSNVVINYTLQPTAQNDSYVAQTGTSLTVSAPGVLTNDTAGVGGSLTATLVSGPTNGTLVFNTDGSFTYTPTNNFTGVDYFTYQAINGSLTSSVATVIISVTVPGELFYDNFTRPGGTNSIFPWVQQLGTWSITNNLLIGTSPFESYAYAYYNGNWTNYSVQAQIQFSSTNGWGGGIGGRLNPITGGQYEIWVYPEGSPGGPGNGKATLQLIKYESWTAYTIIGNTLNLPKVGTSSHTVKMTFQGNNISVYFDGNLLTNVTDDGSIDEQPAYTNGAIGVNMWTENPTAYTMAVGNVIVSTLATVANNDVYTTTKNTTLNVNAPGVLANDSGGNGSLTAFLFSSPTNGSLTLTNNGGFSYAPAINFTGTDGFTYQATDGQTTSSVAAVTINVNNAPVANNDNYSMAEGATLTVVAPGVLANDTGGNGSLTAILSNGPANGSLTLNADGSFSYTPTSNFFGIDTFTYKATDGQTTSSVATVTITVNEVPIANNDIYSVAPGSLLNVAAPGVLANDTSSNSLAAILASSTAYGNFNWSGDGSFNYQSTNNFAGVDDFTYKATDGQTTSSVATAAIEVIPTGKLFLDNFTHSPLWPWIQESGAWGITNNLLTGTSPFESYGHAYLSNNWTDYLVQGQIQFSTTNAWGGGIGGRLTDPINGSHYAAWVYPENSPGGSGNGSAIMKIIKFNSWTDENWSLLSQVTLTNEVGTNWHTIGLAFSSSNIFAYFDGKQVTNITDNGTLDGPAYTNGGICVDMWTENPTAYTLSVSNVVVSLLLNNSSYSVKANTTLVVTAPGVLTNAIDVYGTNLTATVISNPSNGTLILANNGGFSYTPANNFVGIDSFTYQASDGTNSLGTTTVTLTVNAIHNAPVLPVQNNETNNELTLVVVTNTAGETDVPPLALSYSLAVTNVLDNSAATNAVISTNGVISWTPSEAQGPGVYTLTTVVSDGSLSATNSFNVTVNEVNTPPVLPDQNNITISGLTSVVVTNTASDSDIPVNPLGYQLTGSPAGATIDTNGIIRWTPVVGQVPGVYTITTVVTDTNVFAVNAVDLSATNSFAVTVNAIHNAPVLPVQNNETNNELTLVVVTNTAGETDVPPLALSYSLAVTNVLDNSAATNAVISTNGVISWTPSEAQGPGVYTLTTVVSDGSLSATNSFNVTVNEVNTPPVLTLPPNTNIVELVSWSAVATAADSDIPANPLTFALVSGPTGLTVATNGLINWTPAQAQALNTYTVAVSVTDTNPPAVNAKSLSVTNSFQITVNIASNDFRILSVTITNGIAQVTWTSISGDFYRLQYTDSLNSTNWNDVTPDIMATNQTTSTTNALGNSPQRFYRVMLVQYSSLPAPVIQSINLTNGVTTLTWSTVAGHTYRVQYKTNLSSASWSDVTPDIIANASTASTTDIVGVTTQRFYRIFVVQ
jgi:Bacterial Ig domain/Cadherin-like domain